MYNLHFKYDTRDEDYLDWDLGLDQSLTKPSSSSTKTTTTKTTAAFTSSDPKTPTTPATTGGASTPVFDDGMSDFFFDKEHPYFRYYDDIYGDYFIDDPFETQVDCTLQDDGTPKLAGVGAASVLNCLFHLSSNVYSCLHILSSPVLTVLHRSPTDHSACDLSVEGADKVLTLLPGGIDGVYKFVSCQYGRPMYLRQNSPAGGTLTLHRGYTLACTDLHRGPRAVVLQHVQGLGHQQRYQAQRG